MTSWNKAAAPEDAGIRSENILRFFREVQNIQYKLWSFLLIRHGEIIVESVQHPFAAEDKRLVYSVSKTFVSTAIGIAVQENLLEVKTPVISFFPECQSMNMPESARSITVENLLMMSTGHGADSVGDMCNSSEDWPKVFFSREMVKEPGSTFVYESGGTYMMSEIITRVTGKSLYAFAKEKIFAPLEIEDVLWDDHNGVTVGAWGVLIAPRDLAKLGILYKNKGVYNGKRILSEEWTRKATDSQISTGASQSADWSQSYGYQIWRNNQNSFRADGAFGQFCMVFPQEDMVIVTTSEEFEPSRIFPLIEQYLLKNLSDTPLPKDAYTYNCLKTAIKKCETPKVFEPTDSYMEDMIHGKSYGLTGMGEEHQISFSVRNSFLSLVVDNKQRVTSSNVSFHTAKTPYAISIPSCSPLLGEEQTCRTWGYAAHHTWVEDGILLMEICWPETGHTQKWVFDFSEDAKQLRLKICDSGKGMLAPLGCVSDRNMCFADLRYQGNSV